MNSNLNNFVVNIRQSVIDQLDTANSIYDVIMDLSLELEKIPDEGNQHVKEKIRTDIVKLFNVAKSLSNNASKVGNDLSRLVD